MTLIFKNLIFIRYDFEGKNYSLSGFSTVLKNLLNNFRLKLETPGVPLFERFFEDELILGLETWIQVPNSGQKHLVCSFQSIYIQNPSSKLSKKVILFYECFFWIKNFVFFRVKI